MLNSAGKPTRYKDLDEFNYAVEADGRTEVFYVNDHTWNKHDV